MKGHWGPQLYPQVPGNEIVSVVAAVGKIVTKFKVADRTGVGCMEFKNFTHSEEQHCNRGDMLFTYGFPTEDSPTGITQGGYSNPIVVRDHSAIHIPETQEVIHHSVDNGIRPEIHVINAEEINDVWANIVNKKVRYRYVFDPATFLTKKSLNS